MDSKKIGFDVLFEWKARETARFYLLLGNSCCRGRRGGDQMGQKGGDQLAKSTITEKQTFRRPRHLFRPFKILRRCHSAGQLKSSILTITSTILQLCTFWPARAFWPRFLPHGLGGSLGSARLRRWRQPRATHEELLCRRLSFELFFGRAVAMRDAPRRREFMCHVNLTVQAATVPQAARVHKPHSAGT
jgi:hypothetical protein